MCNLRKGIPYNLVVNKIENSCVMSKKLIFISILLVFSLSPSNHSNAQSFCKKEITLKTVDYKLDLIVIVI